MTDIRSYRWREPLGLSYNDSEERVAEAVRVLYSTGGLSAVASVIRRNDLHTLIQAQYKNRREVPKGLDEPDYLCYVAYISIVLLRAQKLHPDATSVKFIVSDKEIVTKRLEEMTLHVHEWIKPELCRLFGGLVPASMKAAIPLQAADVLCWHLQCYYRGRFGRSEENRIWWLLKERPGDLHFWSTEALREAGDTLAILKQKGISGANRSKRQEKDPPKK